MAGLPFRTDTEGFNKAPKGKLPYIEDDGERIANSTFIRWHIERKYQFDFDHGLGAEQRAIAWAFEKMAEDNLYWALARCALDGRCQFLQRPGEILRQCCRRRCVPIVVAMVRRQVRKALQSPWHGPSFQRRDRRARDALDRRYRGLSRAEAVSSWAPSRAAWMRRCSRSLAGVLCPAFDTPLRTAAERHDNLETMSGE